MLSAYYFGLTGTFWAVTGEFTRWGGHLLQFAGLHPEDWGYFKVIGLAGTPLDRVDGMMILGMFAPILLALGGPTTLALRVLPAARKGTAPGGREALVAFLNSTAAAVPEALQVTAVKVLVPAANLLVNTVMPVIFWLAAIEAGKKSGFWATIFGGLAQLIMGNAVPGLVLGILIGKGVEESGWNHVTKVMMSAIALLFVLSGFFRGFDMKLIESFHLGVPLWLENVHNLMSGK